MSNFITSFSFWEVNLGFLHKVSYTYPAHILSDTGTWTLFRGYWSYGGKAYKVQKYRHLVHYTIQIIKSFTGHYRVFRFFLTPISHVANQHSPNQNHFLVWTHRIYRTPHKQRLQNAPNTINEQHTEGTKGSSEKGAHRNNGVGVSGCTTCPGGEEWQTDRRSGDPGS